MSDIVNVSVNDETPIQDKHTLVNYIMRITLVNVLEDCRSV